MNWTEFCHDRVTTGILEFRHAFGVLDFDLELQCMLYGEKSSWVWIFPSGWRLSIKAAKA
jgi:hypothetical protein